MTSIPKSSSWSFLGALLAALPSASYGQTLIAKADVGLSIVLNNPASWTTSVVPGSDDIALFDATMATAANSLTPIGGDLTWRGIKVVDPKSLNVTSGYTISPSTNGLSNESFAYTGRLSLGASGIDLSEAVALPAQTNSFFGISCPLIITADQTWNVPKLAASLPRDLSISGSTTASATFRRTADLDFNGRTVTKTGSGTLAFTFDRRPFNGTLDVQAGTATFANAINVATATNIVQDVPASLAVKVGQGGTVNVAVAPTTAGTGFGALHWDAALTLQGGTLALNQGNYTGQLSLNGTLAAATGTNSMILYNNAATASAPINVTLACPLSGSGDIDIQMTSGRAQDWLVLAGNDSTYTGDITVSAGRVRVSNASGSATGTGTLTVAAGATLAGTGTTGPLTMSGNYRVAINGTSVEALHVQGALDLNGGTLVMAPTGSGVTESSYVIAEATTITGSSSFDVPDGYAVSVVNGGIGKQLVLSAVPDDAYGEWMAGFPGVNPALAGPDDDADGDGLDNALEFVLNSDPSSGVQQAFLVGAPAEGGLRFVFTRRMDAAEAGYQSRVEWSTSLATGSWTTVATSVVFSNSTTETVQTLIPIPAGTTGIFARVKVTHP